MPLFQDAASLKFDHYGHARPGDQKGHEHFGFNDGISQPFVKFEDDNQMLPKRQSLPGQTVVSPGVLVVGQPGDALKGDRPKWAMNGTFAVYRHLKQLVPEFNNFLRASYIKMITGPNLPIPPNFDEADIKQGMDFLGARLMGRWKSGLPVVFTPFTGPGLPVDNPEIGKDIYLNNDFDYGPREETPRKQFACPFAGHARKTGPRTDTSQGDLELHAIRRGGIAYGWEVQPEEVTKTRYERGLSFISYQSSLADGFEFIQKLPFNTGGVMPGFDPIIGQNNGKERVMTGPDPANLAAELTMKAEFVVSQGGEYFFLPSIPTLENMISPGFHTKQ